MNAGSPVYLPQLSLEDSESWAVGLFGNIMKPTTYENLDQLRIFNSIYGAASSLLYLALPHTVNL